MKYLLMIYSGMQNWGHPAFLHTPEGLAMSQEEREAMVERFETLLGGVTASGELVSGTPLADPVNTRTVRVRDGVPATTDGPYLEAKEHLAGFFVVDCETPERAAEIAAGFPDARFAAVEVRPIMDMRGQEM